MCTEHCLQHFGMGCEVTVFEEVKIRSACVKDKTGGCKVVLGDWGFEDCEGWGKRMG